MIRLSLPLLPLVSTSDIGVISLSDHAPVSVHLEVSKDQLGRGRWILHPRLIRDPVMRADLQQRIEDYFSENDTEEIGTSMGWDAFKAVTRGHCISAMTHFRCTQ